MRTVYKYELQPETFQKIKIPHPAKILHVGEQRGKICIWAEVNTEMSEVEKTFQISGTGMALAEHPELSWREHLGTAIMEGGFYVFHVFELTDILF